MFDAGFLICTHPGFKWVTPFPPRSLWVCVAGHVSLDTDPAPWLSLGVGVRRFPCRRPPVRGHSAAQGPLLPLGLRIPVCEVGAPPSSPEGCRKTHVAWCWLSRQQLVCWEKF